MNNFYQITKKYFSYLNKQGYKIENDSNERVVKFSGKNCTIEFMFDSIGYELSCYFVNEVGDSFSLQEASNYMGLVGQMGTYQLGNVSDMEIGVKYLAITVKMILFQNDISISDMFRYICKQHVIAQQEKLRQYYLEYDLKRAEQFWKQKEYGRAKELFEKHLNSLSEVEKKKLEYAKRHL